MAKIFSRDFQQIIIKAALLLIALVFVFWGFGGYNTRSNVILASVNGVEITVTDHDKAYDRLYTNMHNQLSKLDGEVSKDFFKKLNLRQRALDNLIRQVLLEQEAKRLNLYVNNQEVKNAIKNYPEFQDDNGRFNLDHYKHVLRQNRILPAEFEKNRKDMLLIAKIESIVTDSVQVSDDEVLQEYKRRNEKISLDFIAFNPVDYEKGIEVTDEVVREYLTHSDGKEGKIKYESLKDYFLKNAAAFDIPPKVEIEVLAYEHDDYAKKVLLEEIEIKAYYESNIDEFTLEEEVKASHILIKSEVTEDPQIRDEAKKKAEDLLAKIKEGSDFAGIAKLHSQDENTSSSGGNMGWFKRGEGDWSVGMVAFPMEVGEVSDVVALKEGFHIIKVTDRKEERKKALDRVRDGIIEKLSMLKGKDLIDDLTRAARKTVFRSRDVAGYAKKNDVKLITPKPFAFSEEVEGIGKHNAFNRAVFDVDEGDVSDILDLRSGSFIVKVVKAMPSRTPEFEEVLEAIKEKAALEISKETAHRKAGEALQKVQKGAALTDIAKSYATKIQVSSNFVRYGATAPKIGVSEELVNTAFGLTINDPYPNKVFTVNNKCYLIKLTKREDINDEDFKNERPLIVRQLRMNKGEKLFEAFIDGLMNSSEIKIFKEV